MKKFAAVAAVAAALLSTAACGGGRPSVDELKDAILEQGEDLGLTDETAECVAKAVHESDISDGTLQDVVDGDVDVTGTSMVPEDDADAMDEIQDELMECVS